MGDLPADFPAALAKGDPAAEDALAAVRWHQSTSSQVDAAQRPVLYVRAFERTLPLRTNEHWNDAVQHYFRQVWAFERFNRQLRDIAFAYVHTTHVLEPTRRPTQDSFYKGGTSGGFTVNIPAFLDSAAKIADDVPATDPVLRKQVRQAAQWAKDPIAARRHLEQLEQRFDVQLHRALRQRNAVAHGIKTVPAVVATIDSFLARLSAYVVNESIKRVTTGQDLGESLEQHRARVRRVFWRLEQDGAVTRDSLYGDMT